MKVSRKITRLHTTFACVPAVLLTPPSAKRSHRIFLNSVDRQRGGRGAGFLCLAIALLNTLLVSGGGRAEDLQTPPLSNLEVMREIAVELGVKIGKTIRGESGDTISALVRPGETAWYVEPFLLRGIMDCGHVVKAETGGRVNADFGIADLGVTYTDARSDGIFGETVVDRLVRVTISTKIYSRATGEVFMQEDLTGNRRDTVALSAISTLENPNIAVTHGELPDEGFFSSVAGPLIVLGALGVAVYLLFHVRS